VLISPQPDQEGNKLMFLSEWREFPSASCLAGKTKFDDSSHLNFVDMLPNLFPSWWGYGLISTPVPCPTILEHPFSKLTAL